MRDRVIEEEIKKERISDILAKQISYSDKFGKLVPETTKRIKRKPISLGRILMIQRAQESLEHSLNFLSGSLEGEVE